MGNVQNKGQKNELTNFQKRKLKYDFYTFFGEYLARKVKNRETYQAQFWRFGRASMGTVGEGK